jgi:alanine-synthesizing transaminase
MFARRTDWPLEPNALTREIESRRVQGLRVLDLTESNPTRCGFTYESEAILHALAKPAALRYAPAPRGPLEARRAIACYYEERGARVDVDQIFLAASTSEAYSYVFRLLADPGDAILVPQPSYPLFEFLAGLNDLEVIHYPLAYGSEWRIDLDGFEARVERAQRVLNVPRAIIVVHPNNPTGSFVSPAEFETLAELCRRHGMALIADEVFSDYPLNGHSRFTHAAWDSVLTFTLSGLSKISALPQMKLAWIVVSGPEAARRQTLERLEFIADTYLSVGTPVALAAPELLETRRAIQPQLAARVGQNLAALDRRFEARSSGASRLALQGGWYSVLKLEGGARFDDDELAITLAREEGVLIHPGHFYNFAEDGYLVLSLLPLHELFTEGIDKLLAYVRNS